MTRTLLKPTEGMGSPRGYAEFFDTNQGAGSNGAYQAPFPRNPWLVVGEQERVA